MKKYAKPEVNVLTTVFEGYLLAGTGEGGNGGVQPKPRPGGHAKEQPLFESDTESEDEESEDLN
ncbi:hypothetical protein [Prevotella aurantiaca]|jgi:hypothetical protein